MLNIARHKVALVNILKDIYNSKDVSSLIGFKGGTAAYLFYQLPRFSVDLDFTLIDRSYEETLKERIENIVLKYGKIEQSTVKRFTLFLLLSYEKGDRKVKIEISKRVFGEKYILKKYLGIPMLVMREADMVAHKLVALTDRGAIANRDIYDMWFFLKNGWDVNEEIIKVHTGLDFKDYLGKCIRTVENINNKNILHGLGELLDNDQKKWVRSNLKKEALFWLKFYLKEVR